MGSENIVLRGKNLFLEGGLLREGGERIAERGCREKGFLIEWKG